MEEKKSNIRKIIVYLIIGTILASLISLAYIIFKKNIENINQKTLAQTNISYIIEYLERNFKGNYPIPKGDVLLLDNNMKQIHLEDKGISLNSIKDLYVIQGNLCSLDINNEEFISKSYDPKFSEGENKKCYSYSVTADKKYYQIGSIDYINFIHTSKLTGNIGKSITRDFQSISLVQDGSDQLFPYSPEKGNKMMIKLIKGNYEKLSIFEDGLEKKYELDNISTGIYFPQYDKTRNIKISANGEDFVFKIVDPKGNIILMSAGKNNEATQEISYFKFDSKQTKINFINMVGKFAFNLGKMGEDSLFSVQDSNGAVLVIRGTKFILDSEIDRSYTYLGEGKINIDENGKNYQLTNNNSTYGRYKDFRYIDLFLNTNEISFLYGYSSALDSILYPNSIFSINQNSLDNTNKIEEKVNYLGFKIDKTYLAQSGIKKYQIILLKGNFLPELAIKITQSRNNIHDMLNSFCQNGLISINDSYNFIEYNGLKINQGNKYFEFDINKSLNEIINGRNIIAFYNSDQKAKDNSSNLTFYDTSKKQILYKNISSNNIDDKIDGLILFCK